MLEAVGGQSTNDGSGADTEVPESDSGRLLGLLVPHTRDEDEGGRDSGFEASEEDADDDERGEVLADAVEGDADSPEDDLDSKVFRGREALHEVSLRDFADQVGDVEDEGEVRVLLWGGARVCLQTHHVCVVDERLVEVLEEVT